ncbi:hypothetical protein [Caldinitratiruptor microaerophilus]|uniref:Uncharacterized protein n=1 Tax=Caldinitratiruptor microaerophilus TaxID=671077 RepID=A0AA35CPB9_9FIRM|nr:hypothetical protein [Caldinitratiruptor microaerophilus]BDG62333.1 hypothetical protein caldi_34230 [Caldinitratiruptor microaerophilus]
MRNVQGIEFAAHPLAYRYGGMTALADAALAAQIRALGFVVEELVRRVEANDGRRRQVPASLQARRLRLMNMTEV